MGGARVALVAPMPSELRPLVRLLGLRPAAGGDGLDGLDGLDRCVGRAGGSDVVAVRTGIGPERAEAAVDRLLSAIPVDRVVVCGIAGGVPGASAVGDLVVPAEAVDGRTGERFRATAAGGAVPDGVLRTGDAAEYALDAAAVERLRADGIRAVDMETAAVARACHRHGVPWLAFRAVSDMVADPGLGPAVMTMVDDDGNPRPLVAARFLLAHPRRIPRFARLGRDAARAAARAAAAAAANVAHTMR